MSTQPIDTDAIREMELGSYPIVIALCDEIDQLRAVAQAAADVMDDHPHPKDPAPAALTAALAPLGIDPQPHAGHGTP